MNGDDLHQSILNKASKDKFVAILNIPPILRGINVKDVRNNDLINLDTVQFSHVCISIPGSVISAVGVPMGGQTPHVTSQVRSEYPEVKIEFAVDNNFNNYHLLWTWLNVMNDAKKSGMDKSFDVLKYKGTSTSRLSAPEELDVPNSVNFHKLVHRNDFTDYQATITVLALREYNEPIAQFTYTNAFLTTLGNIDYDYRVSDQIMCSFNFAFGQMDFELLDFIKKDAEE